jgi:catechol 2,3-dioxygenase
MVNSTVHRFAIHKDTRLGPVALTSLNLGEALAFYKDTLGLQILWNRAAEAVLGGQDGVPLVALVEERGGRPRPPRTTGLYHFAVRLPSREALAQALRRLGERRYPLDGAADHGVSEALYLTDPEGNGIEITVDRPRKAWPMEEGRLAMVTERLDVEGLLQASPSYWEVAPAGTRIGHVHLHVADLEDAERFYCDALGFQLMQRYGRGALFVSAGGYHHHVGLNTWAGVGAPAPPEDAVGLRYFTVLLPDPAALTQVVRHLEEVGVSVQEGNAVAQGPGTILVEDSSGNRLALTTENARSEPD